MIDGIVAPPAQASGPDVPAGGGTISIAQARRLSRQMRSSPRPLERPVIVLDGWHSPAVTSWGLARRLRAMTSGKPRDVEWISYPLAFSVDAATRHAHRVIARFGLVTREVDLVGISMGGIVARALAAGMFGPRVNVRRVFTLASPHAGAKLAACVKPDRAARQLAPGSALLAELDAAERGYELACYALTHDWLVGARHASPRGESVRWVGAEGAAERALAHFSVIYDTRVLVDIARRLRGEAGVIGAGVPPRD